MRLQGLLDDFLDDCQRRGVSRGRIASYRCRLGAFVSFAGARCPLRRFDFCLVAGFLSSRPSDFLSLSGDRKAISALANHGRRRLLLRGDNPASAVLHRLRAPRRFKRHRTMNPAEDLALRTEACRRDIWPVILLARWAGLRRGEACTARWCDLDLVDGSVELVGLEGGRKHPRVVWLAPWVCLQLRAWMNDPTWPCVAAEPMWRRSAMSADRRLHEVCRKAELRHLTWNVLRASFVTDVFRRGMSAKEESLIVGHSPEVAERYYNEWRAREARPKLPVDPLTIVAATSAEGGG